MLNEAILLPASFAKPKKDRRLAFSPVRAKATRIERRPSAEEITMETWVRIKEYQDLLFERLEEGIAKITINRPEVRNAFRPQTTRGGGVGAGQRRDGSLHGARRARTKQLR
jgi:hypothetical protein